MLRLACTVFCALAFADIIIPANADTLPPIYIDVTGHTATGGIDPMNIFGLNATGGIQTTSGAFPYEARLAFDIPAVQLTSAPTDLPLFGDYTGLMNASFTAFGKSFSFGDAKGNLSLASTKGDNFLSGQASNAGSGPDLTSLNFSVHPAFSTNPIKTAGLAQSFSYSPAGINDPLTGVIFSKGSTTVFTTIDSITYSGPGLKSIFSGKTISAHADAPVSLDHKPTVMRIDFTPNGGLTLDQAANAAGVAAFNWQQKYIHIPEPSPYKSLLGEALTSGSPDPPEGSYGYLQEAGCPDTFPYYYETFGTGCNALKNHKAEKTLSFSDQPIDPCIPLNLPVAAAVVAFHNAGVTASCGGKEAEGGDILKYETKLVGVAGDGTPVSLPGDNSVEWTSSFNKHTGEAKGDYPDIVDGSDGTGGVTVTSVQGVPVNQMVTPIPSTLLLFISGIIPLIVCRSKKCGRDQPVE